MSQDTTQGLTVGDGALGAQPEEKGETTTVIINAKPYDVEGKEISYTQVVNLAYNNSPPTGPNFIITVSYSRGEHGEEGTMLPGDSVKLKSKMVFDVSATDRS